jgi:hypothetical protein
MSRKAAIPNTADEVVQKGEDGSETPGDHPEQSNGTTWAPMSSLGGRRGSNGCTCELKYYYAPYVWQQEATPVGGGQVLRCDYCARPGDVIPDLMPEPDRVRGSEKQQQWSASVPGHR